MVHSLLIHPDHPADSLTSKTGRKELCKNTVLSVTGVTQPFGPEEEKWQARWGEILWLGLRSEFIIVVIVVAQVFLSALSTCSRERRKGKPAFELG